MFDLDLRRQDKTRGLFDLNLAWFGIGYGRYVVTSRDGLEFSRWISFSLAWELSWDFCA
jgi:hypothetical protein